MYTNQVSVDSDVVFVSYARVTVCHTIEYIVYSSLYKFANNFLKTNKSARKYFPQRYYAPKDC